MRFWRSPTELDAAGNTAKGHHQGFSISAAGLTVIALLGAFREVVQAAGVGDHVRPDGPAGVLPACWWAQPSRPCSRPCSLWA